MGAEPILTAWKAVVLPLYEWRKYNAMAWGVTETQWKLYCQPRIPTPKHLTLLHKKLCTSI